MSYKNKLVVLLACFLTGEIIAMKNGDSIADPVTIYVNGVGGTLCTVEVNRTDTVEEIKNAITQKLGALNFVKHLYKERSLYLEHVQ